MAHMNAVPLKKAVTWVGALCSQHEIVPAIAHHPLTGDHGQHQQLCLPCHSTLLLGLQTMYSNKDASYIRTRSSIVLEDVD